MRELIKPINKLKRRIKNSSKFSALKIKEEPKLHQIK
jgi:hypothetical protein